MGNLQLEIHRLFTLFQRVESGEIKVPAFQRSFGWNRKQVLSLIESVYEGYPIGTFMFWTTAGDELETAESLSTKLPDVAESEDYPQSYPNTYVIDGTQRLSSLYNCLRYQATDTPSIFNIIFDLDREKLTHFSEADLPTSYVHLSSVFYPRAFAQDRISVGRAPNFESLMTAVTDLRARFIDYEVVTMTLVDYEAHEVYTVFERLNSTGTQLTREEILKARAKRPK